MRHTAAVPKGFVRYQVLESLSEKPMSGSEIINEIESKTNGRWKPSPGSVYPLLAWLQDNGHVKELRVEEGGLKRYGLTESGKKLLQEQKKIIDEQRRVFAEQRGAGFEFKKHGGFFGPPFASAFWSKLSPEELTELRHSIRRLIAAVFELGGILGDHFSEKTVEDAKKILDDTAEKFEDMNKKLRASRNVE